MGLRDWLAGKKTFGVAEAKQVDCVPDVHIPTLQGCLKALGVKNVVAPEVASGVALHQTSISNLYTSITSLRDEDVRDEKDTVARIKAMNAALDQRKATRAAMVRNNNTLVASEQQVVAHLQALKKYA